MKREIIRVEPLATYLEKYKAPASTVTKHGDTIYVSGSPPFDPKTGCRFDTELELIQYDLRLSRDVPCGEYRLQALFPGKSARAHLH
jgi:hypothetical protein